jgi:hypothetical protein
MIAALDIDNMKFADLRELFARYSTSGEDDSLAQLVDRFAVLSQIAGDAAAMSAMALLAHPDVDEETAAACAIVLRVFGPADEVKH